MLTDLHDRAHEVITGRFGLQDDERKTLETIGEKYGITRERVRQIENAALTAIRKSDAYKKEKAVFDELEAIIHSMGAIVSEEDFLAGIMIK